MGIIVNLGKYTIQKIVLQKIILYGMLFWKV